MKTIVNPLTYNWLDNFSSKLQKQSMTVPNMVMSLDDIIKRFTRGMAVPTLPVQNIEGDFSPYDNLDVFQKIDLKRKIDAKIAAGVADLKNRQKQNDRKKEKQMFETAVALHAAQLIKDGKTTKETTS